MSTLHRGVPDGFVPSFPTVRPSAVARLAQVAGLLAAAVLVALAVFLGA